MVATIGVGASPNANDLPEDIVNCTVDVLALDSRSLQRSTFIFSGIFTPLHLIAIIYHSLMILLRFLDISAINLTTKKFLIVDYIINVAIMMVFLATIVGSYLMGWLWSTYASASADQSDNNADSTLSTLMYVIFVS